MSASRFIFLVIHFSSTRVSFTKKIIMFDGGIGFDLYRGDCFDEVVLFNSSICQKIFRSH